MQKSCIFKSFTPSPANPNCNACKMMMEILLQKLSNAPHLEDMFVPQQCASSKAISPRKKTPPKGSTRHKNFQYCEKIGLWV
jgi:hypothetical protein